MKKRAGRPPAAEKSAGVSDKPAASCPEPVRRPEKRTGRALEGDAASCADSRRRPEVHWRTAVLSAVTGVSLIAAAAYASVYMFWNRASPYQRPPPAPESSILLCRFGLWNLRAGRVDASLVWLFRAKEVHELSGTLATPEGVSLLNDVISALRRRKDPVLADTLDAYQNLLQVLKIPPEGPSRDELLTRIADPLDDLKAMGLALQEPSDVENEILVWKTSLRFCKVMSRQATKKYAELLTRIGVAVSKSPDVPPHEISKWYNKAHDAFELSNSTHSDHYALLVHNMGVVQSLIGNRTAELEHYERAVEIYESLGYVLKESYGGMLYELAATREENGNFDGGRAAFQRAERTFELNGNPWAKLRGFYSNLLGSSRLERGDLAGAILALEVSIQVHEKRGTSNTEGGREAMQNYQKAKKRLSQLPEVDQRKVLRRLKVLQRPGESAGTDDDSNEESGSYLQKAGR